MDVPRAGLGTWRLMGSVWSGRRSREGRSALEEEADVGMATVEAAFQDQVQAQAQFRLVEVQVRDQALDQALVQAELLTRLFPDKVDAETENADLLRQTKVLH